MLANDTYIDAARHLHRAGHWDLALALLSSQSAADVAQLRAQIAVDRYWWRLDDPAPAQAALDLLDQGSLPAAYLNSQLCYLRVLFDRDPRPDDAERAEAGFQAAADDPSLRGWGTFWLGIVADNVRQDPATAETRYREALELCRSDGDLLLESYVVRHLGGHAVDQPDRERLLRRSLHLRSALGARPLVAAALAALADELPDGPERDTLREAARITADDLGLTWLKGALADH
jgi:hypothetical protein